jgi:hypothetical protein
MHLIRYPLVPLLVAIGMSVQHGLFVNFKAQMKIAQMSFVVG